MKIIIIGCGTVGFAICEQLSHAGHTITVIDEHAPAVAELCNVCDVYGIVGNGADVSLLRKAGAAGADLLIAATSGDEMNILACAAAEKLGTKHTVALVRNPEYTGLVNLLRSDTSLSLTINPDLAVASEIFRMLRFPSAAKIDTFHRGRVELAEFALAPDSPICNVPLLELRKQMKMNFLVCAVCRGETIYIPSGDFRLLPGDVIAVTVSEAEITEFFKEIGAYKKPVRDVLITGGGRITYYLEQMLKKVKIRSTVIEKDKALCKELAETCSCTVICGDGTKQELLLEEGIEKVDAFLALSADDEKNAIISLFAKAHGTKKTVTLISSLSYDVFFKSIGLESVVSQKNATAAEVIRYLRSTASRDDTEIESLHRLMNERVEAIEFRIKGEIDGITGVPLKEMRRRAGVLIAAIVRDEDFLLPTGQDRIRPNDSLIVVAQGGVINRIKDILS